ncbi:hypothetical protein MKW98_010319 [Papaver atlanticum]|uniref:Uncharacterized protein n=1 Tax=Papaver atlanticum TaxID=357466 RepID=A0AAD4XHN4_9MAGN|nr:hypothetical protein MKW98_010319 [Papaver atlanticum]
MVSYNYKSITYRHLTAKVSCQKKHQDSMRQTGKCQLLSCTDTAHILLCFDRGTRASGEDAISGRSQS